MNTKYRFFILSILILSCFTLNADNASLYYRLISFPWQFNEIEIGNDIVFSVSVEYGLLKGGKQSCKIIRNNGEIIKVEILNGIVESILIENVKGKILNKAVKPIGKKINKNDYIKKSEKYYAIALSQLSFMRFFGNAGSKNKAKYKIKIKRINSNVFSLHSVGMTYWREVRIHNNNIQQVNDYNKSELLFYANFYSKGYDYALYSFQLQKYFLVLFYPTRTLKGLVMLNAKNESIKIGYEWNKDGEVTGKRDFDKNPFRRNEIKIVK